MVGRPCSAPRFTVGSLFLSCLLGDLHAWNFLLTLNHLRLLQRKKLLLRCLENERKGNICSKLLASDYCFVCTIPYWRSVTKLKLFSCALLLCVALV